MSSDDDVARTRQTYDKVAERFLANTRERSVLRPWLEGFAAALPANALVLDLGAGPGCDSAALRARGLRAIGVDLSLGMLRAGVQEFPGPRVQADVRILPFPAGVAAGAWANASLLHLVVPQAIAALREIHRVLGPGGLLHISLKHGTDAAWESARYGEPRWFQYWTADDLDAALAEVGFRVRQARLEETPRDRWLIRLASRIA